MTEAIDRSQFHMLNKDEYRLDTQVIQDVSDITRHNAEMAQKSNGFSDGRTLRQVASLSHVDYLNALKMGFALDDPDPKILQKELRRYLSMYGKELGNQTVKHILTPNRSNANIIIK